MAPGRSWPAVDDHIVQPEISRDEIIGGRKVVAMPAERPHATQQVRLDYVIGANVAAGYEAAKSKADLFERSDVLSISVRLRPETKGIVGPDDLARMKPTALFVNVARAELVAPGALLAALKKGRPGYTAMDVYEEEPVTGGNHPYLKMDNVLCTPHLGWAEWDNFELYFRECFEQIVKFEKGEELRLGNPKVKPRAVA